MTYYIIKTHYIPTESTKAHDPKVVEHDYFAGKADFSMNTESFRGNMANNQIWDSEYALEHAYTRLCDARRSLKNHKERNAWETNHGHWIVDSEIVTVER